MAARARRPVGSTEDAVADYAPQADRAQIEAVKKRMFDRAVARLTRGGMGEAEARAFVAKVHASSPLHRIPTPEELDG